MTPESAHKSPWIIAEVILGLPFLIGVGLHWLWPISLFEGTPRRLTVLVGLALVLAGLSLIVMARRELSRYRQPTNPGQPTSRLVTTGIFAHSRNPLYLGGVVLLAGLALSLDMGWPLLMLTPALALCHFLLVKPEETYLTARFGDAYTHYTNTVRRWL